MSDAPTMGGAPRSGAPVPPPADREAVEDGGQRYVEDISASAMSDKYPAGLQPDLLPRRHSRAASETSFENRSVSLDVRLTEFERAAIRTRARVLGVKPSAWGRGVLLDALDARRERIVRLEQTARSTPAPELAAAVEQLRRVGVNLNQALRREAVVNETLLRQVRSAVDEVRGQLGDGTRI